MKASELIAMNPEEINEKITQFKSELFNLRFQLATGQLQNTVQISTCKHNIARAKTILRQKQSK